NEISKYHLEAAIAYWHTQSTNSTEKWENILQLYNKLLQIEYSPMAALNRTYALAKARNVNAAINEAEKLNLDENHWYHALLGDLHKEFDKPKAQHHLNLAYQLAKKDSDRLVLEKKLKQLL
ncbi:MAG: RNA polymerase subunit sigma, partial [Cyclobacteriaceae bacterium]